MNVYLKIRDYLQNERHLGIFCVLKGQLFYLGIGRHVLQKEGYGGPGVVKCKPKLKNKLEKALYRET